MNVSRLDQLKDELDRYRPLQQPVLQNLHEEMVLQWTYNSNAIEGNTLSLVETKIALEGLTVGGKTLREHFEAINHREAILFVEDLVNQNEVLSEWNIRQVHQLILRNIDSVHAGVYRSVNMLISGARHRPSDAAKVAAEMAGFIAWYENHGVNLHPVERAARVHADFVKIHPFVDDNGRTARLLMNFELMKSGFPPAVLPLAKRLAYYQALDEAHCCGNYLPFFALIAEIVEQSFDPYWWALRVPKPLLSAD
jgi:Fic family protein